MVVIGAGGCWTWSWVRSDERFTLKGPESCGKNNVPPRGLSRRSAGFVVRRAASSYSLPRNHTASLIVAFLCVCLSIVVYSRIKYASSSVSPSSNDVGDKGIQNRGRVSYLVWFVGVSANFVDRIWKSVLHLRFISTYPVIWHIRRYVHHRPLCLFAPRYAAPLRSTANILRTTG